MNKYEENKLPSKEERHEQKQGLQKIYSEFTQNIFNKEGNFWVIKDKLVDKLIDSTNLSRKEIILKTLERFYLEEGAFPNDLEEEYINLLYGTDAINERLAGGEDFYEIINQINRETRERGIILSSELVGRQIDQLKKNQELNEAA